MQILYPVGPSKVYLLIVSQILYGTWVLTEILSVNNTSSCAGLLSFAHTHGVTMHIMSYLNISIFLCWRHVTWHLKYNGKPRQHTKNWHSISLLNTAYKIAWACIANRLKTVLPKIIHEHQKSFMKGRHVGENIWLLWWCVGKYWKRKHSWFANHDWPREGLRHCCMVIYAGGVWFFQLWPR